MFLGSEAPSLAVAAAPSAATPSTLHPVAFAAATSETMATLLLGMAIGGAIMFAFVALFACAAVKRWRQTTTTSPTIDDTEGNADDAMEAQVPFGSLSRENSRGSSIVLAPETLREKMLAGL